jgi:hypothetical protein
MLFELFHLAASLSGSALPAQELADLAADVRAVALEEQPLFAGADDRARTARLLIVWTWKEAAFRTDALGDKGAACGLLQLHELARDGHSCDELRGNRRLALRVGLAWMRSMRDVCGSVRGGLRAFASGSCAGSLRARDLVAHRCRLAGLGGC